MRTLIPALALLSSLLACGGGGSASTSPAPAGPVAPSGLAAHGSLGHIQLDWSPAAGDTGYNLYRSPDGTAWTQVNGAPLTTAAYDDPIPSPSGDGVVYAYRVTGLKASAESTPSASVRCMHGTRLPATMAAGFTTVPADSPYVAEGTVTVNGGNLVVDAGTDLYVADGATLDLEAGDGSAAGRLWVKGLLRVAASPLTPAAFTAHKVGGTLANNEGFSIWFDNAVNYDPTDGSGCLLQNATITNLASGNAYGGFDLINCGPRLTNLKATANCSNGISYLYVRGTGAIIDHCTFSQITPSIEAEQRSSAFSFDHNRFRGGYYAISFLSLPDQGVDPGQVASNDFDGSASAYLYNVAGSTDVPLGGNFWSGGAGSPPVPGETTGLTTVHFDFTTALSTAPSGVGPSW
ncbi:MAG TPA: fibronectin type III domain-containing protein [Holophagaceae bacterium]|nr:fibronectin type III domain-containing protein [Holophagaceae bacterium]